MKRLLILGAGGHGRVCAEIAEESGYEVSFLDDSSPNPLSKYKELRAEYNEAFVALGRADIREEWIGKLKEAGYVIPVLIHKRAIVSKTATIKEGCVVMAGAIVQNRAELEEGCIVSASAVVDHDAVIGKYCHINCGAVVASMSKVPQKTKVDYGEVWRNV